MSGAPDVIRVVDSHTEGEPTRVVVDGWPQPRGDTMAARRDDMRDRFDHLRRGVVCEPRGHSAVVGALLTPPVERDSSAGIVFFNNSTYLGMCGHGLMGVVRTLQHLGRLEPGVSRFDTPVGTVAAELANDGSVTVQNVPARCVALDVSVNVPELGCVTGDIAWGGNWFFITHLPDVQVDGAHTAQLLGLTRAIQESITAQNIDARFGSAIDHIEIAASPTRADADSRNFVLCSGGEYDRSPCGTGTSARMAVLHARGELAAGEIWRQESITGSMFTGWLEVDSDGTLTPFIRGTAFVTGESTLRFDSADPFCFGFGQA